LAINFVELQFILLCLSALLNQINMKTFTTFLSMIFMSLLPISVMSQAPIKLLSGLENGTYFHLSMDIANNSSQPVEVLTSQGSVDNFQQLMENREISIAFMQYDVLVTNKLLNPKLPEQVRILFPLFLDEEIHLITKKGSKIKNLKDLKGKRVGIGSQGQGTHVTALNIKEKTKLDWENVEISSNEAYKALMDGKIDAYFYVGGTPIQSFIDLPDSAQIQLVNISHKNLNDTYKAKKLEKGTYPWMESSVTTYSVPMLIVVNVRDLNLETEIQVNKLLEDINKSIQKMQKEGHPKWSAVYYQNQEINWPYYFARAKVE
jgi:uncharacterized protein